MTENLGIKPGYRARPAPEYYHDNPASRSDGVIWQPEVYEVAARAARHLRRRQLLDIGCGSADKLAALHPEFQIIGVDMGANLEYCRATHPFGQWIEANLESSGNLDLPPAILRDCVIICSDVIEHLVNPIPLLQLLRSLLNHAPLALLSTPERNLMNRGWLDCGPPANPHHVREWTLGELQRLVQSQGLQPAYAGLTFTNNQLWLRTTILLALAGAGWPGLAAAKNWLPPPVHPAAYWFRVARKAFGEWRAGRRRTAN